MSITLRVVLTCKLHPRYRGIGKPRVSCDCCTAIYAARNEPDDFIANVFGSDDTNAHIMVIADGQDTVR